MIAGVFAAPVKLLASQPTVLFSEIAWAGSSMSASDEWIELANTTDSPIDVSNWYLTGAGSGGNQITLPQGSIIQPYSTFVIANYGQADASSTLVSQANFSTATLSLSNSGFSLYLHDHDGTQVDVAGDGSTPFAGRSGGSQDTDDGRYRSMVRMGVATDGARAEAWGDAQTTNGLHADVEDYGTPGFIESTFFETSAEPDPNQGVVETPEASNQENMLVINELVSDPIAEETEWVEILNQSSSTIDVTNFFIADRTDASTTLESIQLAPGNFLIIESPKGKLNNDGDLVVLKNAEGNIVDQIEYGTETIPSPKKNQSLARMTSGDFALTYQPTPAADNVFLDEPVEVEEPTEELPEEEEIVTEETAVETTNNSEDQVDEKNLQPTSYGPESVRITEIVSDPKEGEEWIELRNVNNEAVDTAGWTVEDASGTHTKIDTQILEKDAFLVINKPKGQLNNDGDSIVLKDATESIIDELYYGSNAVPAPKKGEALALDGDSYQITQMPTPGKPNLIFIPTESAAKKIVEQPLEAEVIEEPQLEQKQNDYTGPLTLRFEELYPNTQGSDTQEEYIALTNYGSETIDLTGWSVADEKKHYTFSNEFLEGSAKIVLSRTSSAIALNNDGDQIELRNPDETLVDRVSYTDADKGYLLKRTEEGWVWEQQELPETSSNAQEDTMVNTTQIANVSQSATIPSMTIGNARELQSGEEVQITGIVTVNPGVFGKQIIYIQSQDGIQLYKHNGDFGELVRGDEVRVAGERSSTRGEPRLKIDTFERVGSNQVVHPKTISMNELDDQLVGQLVSVAGTVVDRSSNTVVLENNGKQIAVYLNSSPPISVEQFERGSHATVVGIVTSYDGDIRVRPRGADDIQIAQTDVASAASSSTGKTLFAESQSQTGTWLVVATTLMLGILVLTKYLPARRRTLAT